MGKMVVMKPPSSSGLRKSIVLRPSEKLVKKFAGMTGGPEVCDGEVALVEVLLLLLVEVTLAVPVTVEFGGAVVVTEEDGFAVKSGVVVVAGKPLLKTPALPSDADAAGADLDVGTSNVDDAPPLLRFSRGGSRRGEATVGATLSAASTASSAMTSIGGSSARLRVLLVIRAIVRLRVMVESGGGSWWSWSRGW